MSQGRVLQSKRTQDTTGKEQQQESKCLCEYVCVWGGVWIGTKKQAVITTPFQRLSALKTVELPYWSTMLFAYPENPRMEIEYVAVVDKIRYHISLDRLQ